ncbi:MAG: sodium-dependent transporter [Flexistipes sinusarabici]|uniref:Sodium-dependent transporter n=1 Tax=Flexistipes sinusarabici TaxID=2352 RepID=A0A5D0MJD3_FLESI|nr:sodium-dependent transporter [Flexistipes sinusarabici]TYB33807.1 MAG: sodium-dependent transporter [Flexistipes sinusarabici]
MKREKWTGKMGFVLVSVGSAVGLGNIWLFSWRVGEYGGAAFLIPYLLFVFGIASVGLMEEWAFGRSQSKGAIGAFENVFEEKKKGTGKIGAALGFIPVAAVFSIYIFYAIVIGWLLKYLFLSFTGAFNAINIPEYFGTFTGTASTIGWHAAAVIGTTLIVFFGVQRGIEKANKIMMPVLFGILIILVFRSVTLEGSTEGLKYIFLPEWSKLADAETWIMALGQAFFTLSLGGATMLVYGSYARDDTDIPSASIQTVFFNFTASMLAALAIIPAVFAFGLDPAAGPGLLFVSIPTVFAKMPGGYIFGILFFLSVVFAGFSSSVSMLEPAVEGFMDKTGFSRGNTVLLLSIVAFLVGLPLDVDMSKFGTWADITTIYVLPFGALVSAVVFFWVFGADKARAEINKNSNLRFGKWFEPYGKYIFVLVAFAVLVLNIIYGGIG